MELITLQQHDSRWAEIFRMEQELISNVLEQTIDNIHHVGSTAVPDLLAKPIIDIAVESTLFPPSQTIIDKLAAIEYEYKGETGIKGRFWFTKGQPRKFNLHFCMTNSDIVQKQIILRDKLTKNDYLRREYELIKLKNYKDKDIDSSDYAFAKSDFIHKTIASDLTMTSISGMTRTIEARTANKGFAIAGVSCFADTFVQVGSSVFRMKFSAKNPRHRKPPKRYQ